MIGDPYELGTSSYAIRWQAQRNADGTREVFERYPDGACRVFHNVPATLVDALVTERRLHFSKQISEVKRHLLGLQHRFGERYNTQHGGAEEPLPILDAIKAAEASEAERPDIDHIRHHRAAEASAMAARKAGTEAYKLGKPRDANPYTHEQRGLLWDWDTGWFEAYRAAPARSG